MNALFFAAETPRAGESGHRFIVSPGCSEGSSLVAEFCRNAAKYGAGKNFVGVTQPVVQRLPNGAVRRGVETLVLVGVDYPRLDNGQKQQLKAILTRRLADLETLVTQRIDWKREGQSLAVTRQEFGNWLREDGLLHFPCAPIATGPLTERRRLRISYGLAAVLVVIVLGVGTGQYIFKRTNDSDRVKGGAYTESNKGKQSTKKNEETSFNEALQKLAKEIDKPFNEVALALYKGVSPDQALPKQLETLVKELRNTNKVHKVIIDYPYNVT
jgi:hypothetical protein